VAVVEDLDELDHRPADLADGGPRLAVNQFLLEGREPAFTDGVGQSRQLRHKANVGTELSS